MVRTNLLISCQNAARCSGWLKSYKAALRDQDASTNEAAVPIIRTNPSPPSALIISSGSIPSGRVAILTDLPGSRIGKIRSMALPAAFWPAISPSKHKIGSSCSFQTRAICSSVRAVPRGANAAAF